MRSQDLTDNRMHTDASALPEIKGTNARKDRLQPVVRFIQKAELFASKGLSYHHTYARWRIRRLASRWGSNALLSTGLELATKLRLEMPELAKVRAAYAEKNEQAVKLAIQTHFRARSTPQFAFELAEIEQIVALVDQIDGVNKDKTIRNADEICQNTFTFRKAPPVHFEGLVNWQHCPDGNTDWTWDLNRHAYFESLGRAYWYTGDEKYALKFSTLLKEWLASNPASVVQPSWSSVFEVAFRINTWIWALHFFQHSPSLDADTHAALLAGLWMHGHFLDTHLELHAQNNHLLLEAKALAMVGLLFPEFESAAQWRERGLALFCQELRDQVCEDGVHGERAALYHRIITSELLELLVIADNNGIALPPETYQTLRKMVQFELWITKPDGQVSLVGDSALEDVHLRFSGVSGGTAFTKAHHLKAMVPDLSEKELWLLGAKRANHYLDATSKPVEIGSRAFLEGGYFAMRSGSGQESRYALFDCGPFGYKLDSTHGHADALNLELYAHGQTWLVDPGVYSTHLGWNWRRFFRGTRSHNTVVVDEQDQSLLLDGRRVYHPAETTLHQWVSNDLFDFVAGSHNGYERLSAPISHRRQIFFVKSEYWVVIDQLTGVGEHCFDLYFHLMPGLKVQCDVHSRAVHVENNQGASLDIIAVNDTESSIEMIEGALDPVQGWVSLYSGEKRPAPALRYRRTGAAPTYFCTVLYPHSAPSKPGARATIKANQVVLATKPSISEQPGQLALTIEMDETLDHLVIAPGTAGIAKLFAGFETDAELLYMRQQKENHRLLALEMHNGTKLCYQFQPLSMGVNRL
jgi:hypothetical protein